jgi:uncharacterized protein (DUF1800 family)
MALPELIVNKLDHKRAAHLLRRATFGATKEQVDEFTELSPSTAVDRLFRTSLPDPALPIDPKTGQPWFVSGTTDANSEDGDLENYFLGWLIGQMMSAGIDANLSLAYSAREKIVLFLHTHFTTIRSKVASSRALYFQNQLYRMFALDDVDNNPEINFKTLSVKVSIDNAMIRLLDGNLNVNGSANENYARELLELYSIGRGLEGTLPASTEQGDYIVYKEEDVRSAARVLSGWDFDETFLNTDPDTGLPRAVVKGNPLNASAHDNDPKQFSERFGNAVISPDPLLLENGNPTEESALDEIRQLIDLIYSNSETARNICRKIYRFFVWAPHTLEETIPIDEEIISEMVRVFQEGHKIQPVIENLLKSQHFYEAGGGIGDDNFGAIIKSPLDLTIGTLRYFKVNLPDMLSNASQFYETTSNVIATLGEMGMSFFEPYDVAGYEAYHQFPVYQRFWITPNALTKRYEFIRTLITFMETGIIKADVYEHVNSSFPAEAPDARTLIVALAKYFFPVSDNLDFDDTTESGLTTARMNYFKNALLGGFEESYWTTIWFGSRLEDKRTALENLINAMMQSPEYQLA